VEGDAGARARLAPLVRAVEIRKRVDGLDPPGFTRLAELLLAAARGEPDRGPALKALNAAFTTLDLGRDAGAPGLDELGPRLLAALEELTR
jgi:hypothetical protein